MSARYGLSYQTFCPLLVWFSTKECPISVQSAAIALLQELCDTGTMCDDRPFRIAASNDRWIVSDLKFSGTTLFNEDANWCMVFNDAEATMVNIRAFMLILLNTVVKQIRAVFT